jgi:hypothetical protein
MRIGAWIGLGLLTLAGAGPAAADIIHLVGGGTLQVDAWRDVGDAIEFTRSGGILRIPKADVVRVEGNTVLKDLRMYSAPASLSGSDFRLSGDRAAALKGLAEFLAQGAGLFGQTVLSAQAKAEAFERLGRQWRQLEVPEALREAHERGQAALQQAAEAYAAEDQGTAPDAQERVEAARKAVEEVRELVKKAETEG